MLHMKINQSPAGSHNGSMGRRWTGIAEPEDKVGDLSRQQEQRSYSGNAKTIPSPVGVRPTLYEHTRISSLGIESIFQRTVAEFPRVRRNIPSQREAL